MYNYQLGSCWLIFDFLDHQKSLTIARNVETSKSASIILFFKQYLRLCYFQFRLSLKGYGYHFIPVAVEYLLALRGPYRIVTSLSRNFRRSRLWIWTYKDFIKTFLIRLVGYSISIRWENRVTLSPRFMLQGLFCVFVLGKQTRDIITRNRTNFVKKQCFAIGWPGGCYLVVGSF